MTRPNRVAREFWRDVYAGREPDDGRGRARRRGRARLVRTVNGRTVREARR